MSLVKCHDCEKEISDSAKFCMHCGCPSIEPEKEQGGPEKIVHDIIGVIFLPLYCYLLYSSIWGDDWVAIDFSNGAPTMSSLISFATAFAVIYFFEKTVQSVAGMITRSFY